MDRDTILHTLSSGEALCATPPYRRKEAVENLVRSVLDALDVDRRERDQWEPYQPDAALAAARDKESP